jgi:hypothetical protein
MFSVESARAELPYPEFRDQAALVIPYYDAPGKVVTFERDGVQNLPFCRVRYLGPPPPQKLGFSGPKKLGKYGQPVRSGVHAFLPLGVDWAAVAANPREPVFLCEGEKKATKLALEGYNAVGIGGCWNWLRAGGLKDVKHLLHDLEDFVWESRDVYLALDGDAATNASVAAAECHLALEFGLRRGASVYRIRFPAAADGSRMGADDYIVAHGVEAFEKLARGAEKMREADALVAELNTEYAVVCTGGKTFAAHFGVDDARQCQKVAYFSKHDFELRLANRDTTNPDTDKPAKLAKVWLAHPQRRQYLGGVTLAPLREVPEDTLNLWRGFSVAPRAGDWSLLRTHILENICSGNRLWFDYLMDWLARLVQVPGEPGQVAIAMRGKKGVGKGKFACWVGRLMRDHFFHATQSEHVVGKFNSHLLDTVLLFADEALFAADPRNEKILNGLITEETRTSEQKFMPAITVPNYLHLVMATNSTWAVPATENERRYFVLDVSDAHMQDLPYFAAIDRQMESGGAEAMLHELHHRDISNFEVRRVPRTAALAEQQVQTLHGRGDVAGWVYDFLSSGEIKGDRFDDVAFRWASGELEIPKNEARRIFDGWAKQRGRRPVVPVLFGREMRAVLSGALSEKRPRRATANGRREDGERPENYVLRPLEDCRAAYRVALAMPDLWSVCDE